MKIKMNIGREYDNRRSDMLWNLVEELEKERRVMTRVRIKRFSCVGRKTRIKKQNILIEIN